MKHAKTKLSTTIVLFSLLVSTNAQGANPLGPYVGAGGGRAHLGYECYLDGVHKSTCLDKTDFGWTAFAGLRPLPFLGAELQYLDFGHARRFDDMGSLMSEHARALALFSTGTVSLHGVDLYAKAGLGRLQTKTAILQSSAHGCVDSGACGYYGTEFDKTAVRFVWGLGAQLNLSSLALRGEYVRFSVPRSSFPNGEPDLLSVALLWKF